MFETIKLPNGVRIVYEKLNYVRSAAVGIWVKNGSRNELPEENGISHFIEHMLFKGTESRSTADIATAMDAIGGQVNAFTSKECTEYYLRALDIHLKDALDVLFDMFFHSTFTEQNIALERGVIFEEIDMYEDTPDDLVSDLLMSGIYSGSSLGMPVIGTKETLSAMTGADLKKYVDTHYVPEHVVVAITGSFDDSILDYIRASFSQMPIKQAPGYQPAKYRPFSAVREKPIEQNHICIGYEGVSFFDERRYAIQILSNIVGGGMSSRLFSRVRDDEGLCYSIYSFANSAEETGIFGIYTALNSETELRAVRLIHEILNDVSQNGVTEEEFVRNREQIKANILMGLESTVNRMNRLGRGALLAGKILTPDEIIEAYDKVTMEEVNSLAKRIFDPALLSVTAVGKVRTKESYLDLLR